MGELGARPVIAPACRSIYSASTQPALMAVLPHPAADRPESRCWQQTSPTYP